MAPMRKFSRPGTLMGRGFFGRLTGAVISLFTVALLAGCGDEYPQSSIAPMSDFAEIIHSLYVSIFWWTMLILAVVWVLLTYAIVKFRAKPDDPRPKQIRGHMGLEIGWTVGPAIIVIAIAIPSIQAVFATQRPVAEDAMIVEVTGHRFWWEFHYPEQGVTTANELWLPVDRPVSLRLAASDVIHSFWVPMLGGKRDLNPVPAVREGREPKYNWLHLTPTETGVFMGQCAEFCGEAHSWMAKRVVVESEEAFQEWLERWLTSAGAASAAEEQGEPEAGAEAGAEAGEGRADEDPLVARGREVLLRESTCVACHAIQGTSAQGRIGPDLTLFGARTTVGAGIRENNRENLIRWIKDPHSMKPGAAMPGVDYRVDIPGATPWPATGLSDEQVEAVAAYLLSLR
jgi:cytochrome c oxidase subunit II